MGRAYHEWFMNTFYSLGISKIYVIGIQIKGTVIEIWHFHIFDNT